MNLHSGGMLYKATEILPSYLRNPSLNRSTSPADAVMMKAFGSDVDMWNWLEEKVEQPDGSLGPRPELTEFSLAMVGQGRTLSVALCHGKHEPHMMHLHTNLATSQTIHGVSWARQQSWMSAVVSVRAIC